MNFTQQMTSRNSGRKNGDYASFAIKIFNWKFLRIFGRFRVYDLTLSCFPMVCIFIFSYSHTSTAHPTSQFLHKFFQTSGGLLGGAPRILLSNPEGGQTYTSIETQTETPEKVYWKCAKQYVMII